MPQRIKFKVLAWDVTKEVPATNEEYNALAPKRNNPVLEDATDTIIYRGTSPVVRDSVCSLLAEVTGRARINHGTDDEPQWESERRYVNRVVAEHCKANNIGETEFLASLQEKVQAFADAAPFPVAEKENKGTGPAIGKRDLELAEKVIADGKGDAVAAKLGTILNREVAADAKSIARALADKRKAENAAAEAKLKAELGV